MKSIKSNPLKQKLFNRGYEPSVRTLVEKISKAEAEKISRGKDQHNSTPSPPPSCVFLTFILKIQRHTEKIKKLRMFLFSLAEDVEEWFYSLPIESITTWEDMEKQFE